ncbi:MAG TPA: HNH endonuclease [Chthonomonadaceae bacterium]|nr:HNH endonuclease [Chthonomonadaceae bacterium]
MRAGTRPRIRVLYDYRCGYCGVRESDAGARLTVDHFRPRSDGGEDDIDNLVYCCHGCNEFKGDYWHTDESQRLLHPVREDIGAHLAEAEAGRIRALTARGAVHIDVLRLNRPELIAYRLQRQAEDALIRDHEQTLQLLETLKQDNDELRGRIADRDSSRRQG